MNQKTLAGLITLNVVILAALAVVTFAPRPAEAQLGGAAGSYMMVSGDVKGRSQQAAVYVLDLQRQELAGFMYDSNRDELLPLNSRRVADDIRSGGR